MNIIPLQFHDQLVEFTSEAFVNLTEMCAIYGKEPWQFLRLDSTKRYITALESASNSGDSPELGSRFDPQNLRIKKSVFTSKVRGQAGTWAHPSLAIACAQWLSPDFYIWCNEIIRKIFSGELALVPRKLSPNIPPFLPDQRYEHFQHRKFIVEELKKASQQWGSLLVRAKELAAQFEESDRTYLRWYYRWERGGFDDVSLVPYASIYKRRAKDTAP